MLTATQIVGILTASIAPVIVISGVGLLLLTMTNRYGRVIDRTRALDDALDRTADDPRRAELLQEMSVLYRRARMLRQAIILSAVSILFVVLTVFSIFAAQAGNLPTDTVAAPFFGLSLIALILSLYWFIREVGLSLKALEVEIGRHLPTPKH